MSQQARIGVAGLAVMGSNLARNLARRGHPVALYNRTVARTEELVAEHGQEGEFRPARTPEEFVAALERPRRIIVMVKAGEPTDAVIDQFASLLEPGDVIIDGGNAHFADTRRRDAALRERGLQFVGMGISGGEEGALHGPSLMPGGPAGAYESLAPMLRDIAAVVDGVPCVTHIGPDGAGHYVKMVHNGIEYIDMQLICEAYQLMKTLLGMSADEMSKVFNEWDNGDLASYLIEITADILQQPDPTGQQKFIVDAVLDTAGQKGTGKWTSTSALDLGIPANSIAEAVFARCLSALKDERNEASKTLQGPKPSYDGDKQELINAIRDALYCSKICAYAQGFQLMREAQNEYNWKLDFATIAKIWRGGCIIRARFLQKITDAYTRDPNLVNLMLDSYFRDALHNGQDAWRRVVALAAQQGVSAPAFMSALAYFDGYRSERLPANLLQAQRDYFGAHTYERVDQPRGQFYHIDWPEPGRPQLDA